MAKAQIRDRFSNKAYGTVTESAANTLTFSEIQTNVNIFDKVAWIVNRIEWYLPTATLNLIGAAADTLQMALTASNTISALGLDNPSVIDMSKWSLQLFSSVGVIMHDLPIIRDFSELPGGGLIIAPRPLYVAAVGESLASAATVECRISFQQMQLAADEYVELIDFYRIVS